MADEEKMVNIEIDLSDEDFMAIAKEAHRLDITFNNMVNKILREKMDLEEKKITEKK